MNRPPSVSTTRYSVNTSTSQFQIPLQDTVNRNTSAKRFSYQDTSHHQPSSLKENLTYNHKQSEYQKCMNHPDKTAPYSALQDTSDPMPLCERCAILVASKGFEISKI